MLTALIRENCLRSEFSVECCRNQPLLTIPWHRRCVVARQTSSEFVRHSCSCGTW